MEDDRSRNGEREPAKTPAPDDSAASTSDDSATETDGGRSVDAGGTVEESEAATTTDVSRPLGLPRWAAALLPILILGLLLGGLVVVGPLSNVQAGEPVPDVTVSHHTVPDDHTIVLHVTNDGAESVTVEQVLVDEAYWDHTVLQNGQEARTIQPRDSARIEIPYHWQAGWDYEVALLLEDGTVIEHEIEAIQESPGLSGDLLWTLALVGLFVGVVPVALGMLWFPFIRSMERRWLHAVLAFAGGVLAFLAVDAAVEALELVERIPGAFEGTLLVALGALGAALGVQAVSAWREHRTDGSADGLWVAYLVALGIGLHNLAEGLAIGSSFALGRASLGAFLIVGFAVHNVTEGPAVVAPVARNDRERPAIWHFVALGALAGSPVILGGWIGSLSLSPTVGAVSLAIGVGAIAQVLWELAGLVRADGGRVGSTTNLLAVLAGFAVMYVTDLLVVL